jgi:hypothetical protein
MSKPWCPPGEGDIVLEVRNEWEVREGQRRRAELARVKRLPVSQRPTRLTPYGEKLLVSLVDGGLKQ